MKLAAVARLLDVGENTVKMHIAAGRLHPDAAGNFDVAEVETLRADLDAPTQAVALAIRAPLQPVHLPNDREHVHDNAPPPPVLSIRELAAKPVLTLDEAVRYTSISRGALLSAIHAGHLRAFRSWGRGMKIRRHDLEAYIEKPPKGTE